MSTQPEESSFEAAYLAVGPDLLRYLRAKAPGDAEDLASDVWFEMSRQWPFQGTWNSFRAVLFTIARRRVMDLRRNQRRRVVTVDLLDHNRNAAAPDQPETDVVDAFQAQATINTVVRKLPEAQADVVLLRVVAGLPVAEVARLLGRSPGAIRVLQYRALQRLARDVTAPTG